MITRRRAAALLAALPLRPALPAVASPREPGRAAWTIMVYMSGDNDLEKLVVKDLERELAAVGSTAAVQVVALADRRPGRDASRGDWKGVRLFHVAPGMKATADSAIEDWGERSLGNPETLADFVAWSRERTPAERYALFLWGHSWSWHPGVTMWDATSDDALNPAEIRAVLPRLGPLALVGYDSCNAGAIETETLWRGHAEAIAHSQEWVDVHGFDYAAILRALNARPEMTAGEAAAVASASAEGRERTWSAVALDGRHRALTAAVRDWSAALLAGLPRHRRAYDLALKATQHFQDAPMDRDLADLAAQVNARVDDPAIRAAGSAVIAAVDAAVLRAWSREDYPRAHGITIHVPERARGRSFRAYRALDFAAETGWDAFLRAWRR